MTEWGHGICETVQEPHCNGTCQLCMVERIKQLESQLAQAVSAELTASAVVLSHEGTIERLRVALSSLIKEIHYLVEDGTLPDSALEHQSMRQAIDAIQD